MNTSESVDWPKQTFLDRGKVFLKKVHPSLYAHVFSHTYILDKLKKATRKSTLNTHQEQRLKHFLEYINTPENVDILEHICTMKTSSKYDMQWFLECLEKAEQQKQIWPQFIIDTTLVFYNAPPHKSLSLEEKTALSKLKKILIGRVPKVQKILPTSSQKENS